MSADVYRRITWLGLLTVALGATVGIVVNAGLGWDFANFYDTGRRVAIGDFAHLYDEHALIAGQAPQGHMKFFSAPLSGYLYVPLSYLSPVSASRLFKLQGTAALAAALLLIWYELRHWTWHWPSRAQAGCLFVWGALAYQPFWTIYRVGGQTTPTILLLLVLAWMAHRRGWWRDAALAWTLVLLIKPAFVLPAAFLACSSGLRFFRWMVTWGTLAGLLSLSLCGWEVHREFLHWMGAGNRHSVSWNFNSGTTTWLENLHLLSDPRPIVEERPQHLARWVWGQRLLLAGLGTATLWALTRDRLGHDVGIRRTRIFWTAVIYGVAVMSIVWEHYLSVLFVPFLWLLLLRPAPPRPLVVLAACGFVLAVPQNLILIHLLEGPIGIPSAAGLVLLGLLKGGPSLLLPLTWTWASFLDEPENDSQYES